MKGSYENEGGGGSDCHASHEGRYLGNYCNEAARGLHKEMTFEKSTKIIKHEEDTVANTENF